MHKIRALCPLIRTETLKEATAGRRRERLRQNLLRSYKSFSEEASCDRLPPFPSVEEIIKDLGRTKGKMSIKDRQLSSCF